MFVLLLVAQVLWRYGHLLYFNAFSAPKTVLSSFRYLLFGDYGMLSQIHRLFICFVPLGLCLHHLLARPGRIGTIFSMDLFVDFGLAKNDSCKVFGFCCWLVLKQRAVVLCILHLFLLLSGLMLSVSSSGWLAAILVLLSCHMSLACSNAKGVFGGVPWY